MSTRGNPLWSPHERTRNPTSPNSPSPSCRPRSSARSRTPTATCACAAKSPATRARTRSGHVYFALKDETRQDRRRDLEGHLRPHAGEARRGHGGHRHRQAHHLSQPLELPDHHRDAGARRPRRADGAARRAQAQARRRGPVRRGAKAAPAVPARGDRRRHLADRRGDPRHPASARRPLPAPRHRLAGQGAGRRLGRAGRRRDPRLQRAARGRPHPPGPIC